MDCPPARPVLRVRLYRVNLIHELVREIRQQGPLIMVIFVFGKDANLELLRCHFKSSALSTRR